MHSITKLVIAITMILMFPSMFIIFYKTISRYQQWNSPYKREKMRGDAVLALTVKGSPFVCVVIFFMGALTIFCKDHLWGCLIFVGVLLIMIFKNAFRPTTYIFRLHKDAFSIGIFNLYKAPDYIYEVPLSNIIAVHTKANRDRTIDVYGVSTYSFGLFKYSLIYILCQHDDMKGYYKVRVSEEIYSELNNKIE